MKFRMTEEPKYKCSKLSEYLEERGYVESTYGFLKQINNHEYRYSNMRIKHYLNIEEIKGRIESEFLEFDINEGMSGFSFLFRIRYVDIELDIMFRLIDAFEEFGKHEICRSIYNKTARYFFRFCEDETKLIENDSPVFVFTQTQTLLKTPERILFSLDGDCFLSKPKSTHTYINIKDVTTLEDWLKLE